VIAKVFEHGTYRRNRVAVADDKTFSPFILSISAM
jgi:hypothetical protein